MDRRKFELSRRQVLKCGAITGATVVACRGLSWAEFFQTCPTNCDDEILPDPGTCGIQEVWSTTPFIVSPFTDSLPQPAPLEAGYRHPGGILADPADPNNWLVQKWTDPTTHSCHGVHLGDAPIVVNPGDMRDCLQDSYGGQHEVKPADIFTDARNFPNGYPLNPNPILYHIRLMIAKHAFTTSKVLPIDRNGAFAPPPALSNVVLDANNHADLPGSVIYGFNGTFPGPMINVDYGRPVIVRFENDLDIVNLPAGISQVDLGDFGVPHFLTHLHNGHTAPESDGQPHYMQHNDGGYIPLDYCDNLYLNWPAGGNPDETQSFLWFHDHRMHHTGANVYKGMVGLFPMYDPGVKDADGNIIPGSGLDSGNETDPAPNLGLPGRRTDNPDGSFSVKYDIPMAFYDCRMDDGVTPHADFRIGDALITGDVPVNPPPPADPLLCGATHPEMWGMNFFRYHPNHGFVGDLFTVNGIAFPVLHVEPRKYRFRFLDASIARVYELAFMTSAAGPQPRPGTQGQWQIPDGVLWKQMTQIASMGGLLSKPILRDSMQIFPATRREVVLDFSDAVGQTIYLTNILEMPDGRKPNFHPGANPNTVPYKVPMVKIVVDLPLDPVLNPGGVDPSKVPASLRPMPAIPTPAELALLPHRQFTLARSGKFGDAAQWLINDLPFDPTQSLTELPGPGNPGGIGNPKLGTGEVWTVVNGGGGWVHPMHMHMEEHTVLARVGSTNPHPEDIPPDLSHALGKEDVANLDPGEAVTFFRRFRTFTGAYVAHCHNLAHEDHNMMFGWKIDPAGTPPPLGAPVPADDHFTMQANTTAVIPVLANDTTSDGQLVASVEAITLTVNPGNGSAAVNANHTGVSYTPKADFVGTDVFSYTITLGGITSREATVSVTIVAAEAPIANDDQFSMEMNTTGVIPVLANDTTAKGKPLPAVDAMTLAGSAPFNGKAVVTGNSITYTPDLDYFGTDTFSYTITVGGITSAPATVFVTVVNPAATQLTVKKAMVNTRGKRVATEGPKWTIQGSGADPGATVTITAGNTSIGTAVANKRGVWKFVDRAAPSIVNPTEVTVSAPGAQALTVPLTVR